MCQCLLPSFCCCSQAEFAKEVSGMAKRKHQITFLVSQVSFIFLCPLFIYFWHKLAVLTVCVRKGQTNLYSPVVR